jgi:hypothetical protein
MPIIKVGTMTRADITAALAALTTKINALPAKIAAKVGAGDVSTPEEDKALADLTTAINALDASVS